MSDKPVKPLSSHQRAENLIKAGAITRVPTAVTFLVRGSDAAPREVTVYPLSDVATCRCTFGLNRPQGMKRGHECYHAKAAWKLVDRDDA